jgi:PKD repeat protein
MKKIFPLIAIMTLSLSSCYYYDEPNADFSASTVAAEPYEKIYFSNYSSFADHYFWDFGDGYTSDLYNPEHYYNETGTYTISLTVSYQNGVTDRAFMTIEVYYTELEVTVSEWNSDFIIDNLISNAEVTLYASYDDWFNFNYPIETRYTNMDGIAFFPHVEPVVYYIDVYHTYYDNGLLGQEDVSYIQTLHLAKTELNTFIAWVDFFPPEMQQRNKHVRIPYKAAREKRSFKNIEIVK